MALRGQRQVPNIYFGRPGKLVTLPWPKGDLGKPYERQTFDFVTGSGFHQVSSLAAGSRPYTIGWEALHVDNFAKLSQYRIGANGPGPWVLIDPSEPNLMPANVSAATGLYADATELISVGGTGGTAGSNSNATYIHRTTGYRSISWRFLASPIDTAPVLRVQPLYRNWYGIPVVVGLPYTFSSWARVDGVVETNATLSARIQWWDAAGALLSESTGGDVAVTGWQRLSVTATAPANAVYADVRWVAVGSTLTLNGIVYIDEPMFEQDSVVNDWVPGTGLRPVEIVDLGEGVPFESRFRTGVAMTVRELSR
jgi:hypothetical protein